MSTIDAGKALVVKTVDWGMANPKKYVAVAAAKGVVVDGLVAAYQTSKSSSNSSSGNGDSIGNSQQQSTAATFAQHFAKDAAFTAVGAGVTYGAARAFSKTATAEKWRNLTKIPHV